MEQEKEGLSVLDMWNIIKKNIIIVVVTTVVATILAFVYTSVAVKPKYQSRGSVVIDASEKSSATTSSGVIIDGLRFVPTLQDYFKEDKFLTGVVYKLVEMGQYNAEDIELLKETNKFPTLLNSLKNGLNVENTENSLVIQLYFTASEGTFAQATMEAIINRITSITKEEYEVLEGIVKESSPACEYYVVDSGKTTYIILGIAAGLVIGIGIAFIKELTNTSIRNSEEIETLTEYKVLGVVPAFGEKKEKKDGKKN